MKIIRKNRKSIAASEMEVGQVARIVETGLIVENVGGEIRGHGCFSESDLVEPVQTIDTTPKTIRPCEMEDGDIGEIVEHTDRRYVGRIVQKNNGKLVAVGLPHGKGVHGW